MKYLLFVFAMIFLDVVGCGPRHYEEVYLDVNPSKVILENKEGASSIISISSNSAWTVIPHYRENGGWLDVYPISGTHDGKIKVTAHFPVKSPTILSCTLTIESGGIQREVKVIQIGE